jgi:hypothetical protein
MQVEQTYSKCLLHVDWCTKNKRMNQIPMYGLFLTCTESLLFYQAHAIHTYNDDITGVYYVQEKYTLTRKGGPLFMVVNPHTLWSLA